MANNKRGTGYAGLFVLHRPATYTYPVIEHMLGRCPKTTRIYANAILEHDDYGILPPNVIIVPVEKLDIGRVIKDHLDLKPEERLNTMLHDIASAGIRIC